MEVWMFKVVHLFDKLFAKMGIDLGQMYAIVETKLMMDKRRVYLNWRQDNQAESNNHLRMALAGFLLFGAVIALIVFYIPSFMLAMIYMHAYIIFMMGMTLITDFSAVLLDTADSKVIQPTPVNSKTFFMARQIHIILYLLQFTSALGVLPVIAVAVKYGIVTGIASIITVMLSSLLSVLFAYFLYLLVLRYVKESTIKEVINWLQIAMAVFFAAGYQLILHFIDIAPLAKGFQMHWYSYLLPPVWMAMFLESVYTLRAEVIDVVMIMVAFGSPVLLFWILNKYLAPFFSTKVLSLNSSSVTIKPLIDKTISKPISHRLAALVTKSKVSQSAFEATWKITGRDKSFKLQFYPSLGYVAVFIFFFVFYKIRGEHFALHEIAATSKYLWFIYLPILIIANAGTFITYNENYSASWIYHATPLKKPGELIVGSLQALFVKYFLPCYFLMFAMCFYVWRWAIVDDFLFGLSANYLCFLITCSIGKLYLPFSRQPNSKDQGGQFIRVVLQMLIIGVLVGIHYFFILRYSTLSFVFFPVIVFLCWLLQRILRNLPWQKISV